MEGDDNCYDIKHGLQNNLFIVPKLRDGPHRTLSPTDCPRQ